MTESTAVSAGVPEPLVLVAFPAGDPARGGAARGGGAHGGAAREGAGLDGVALVTLNRPQALNALSYALLDELDAVLEALDADAACRAIVITGAGTRAFAAGADVRELAVETTDSLHGADPFAVVDRVGRLTTPTIAAVRGFALGGGAELAMACDVLVAGDDAKFGQPEIGIGVIPGAGGTQRLARAIGRTRAMDLILTGRQIDAAEAERLGLVSRVVPAAVVLEQALELAAKIASMPALAVQAAKAAIRATESLPIDEGLRLERDRFEALFGTDDQREGMTAFLEKRPAAWRHR